MNYSRLGSAQNGLLKPDVHHFLAKLDLLHFSLLTGHIWFKDTDLSQAMQISIITSVVMNYSTFVLVENCVFEPK